MTAIGFGSTQVTATHDTLEAQAEIAVPRPLTDREILEVLYNETGGSAWTRFRPNWES